MKLLDLQTPHGQLLRERLQPFIEEATSPATSKAYKNALRHFKDWGGTLPATVEMVADYLAAHAQLLSPATLQKHLAALSRAHDTVGLSNPVRTELVRLTMRGIRRKRGTAQRQVKALVKEDILHILSVMEESVKAMRDATLLLIGFAGAFRRSELVTLNVEDLEFVPQGVLIILKRSKTDQEGEGRRIAIPCGRGHVCPVRSLRKWIAAAQLETGPLFRRIGKGGHIADNRLTDQSVALIIKKRAEVIGLRANDLSGHSLRAGLATSAAQHGIRPDKIRQQTGHSTDTMLARYIRDGNVWVDNAAGIF